MNITMRFLIFLLLPCLAQADVLNVTNPASLSDKHVLRWYASAYHLEGNDFTAQKYFNDHWQGKYAPRDGTNLSLLNTRIESGVIYQGFQFALLRRKEIFITSNRDTTDMLHFNKQHVAIPSGRPFNIDFSLNGFEAEGAKISKGMSLYTAQDIRLTAGAGLSLLRGKQYRTGHVSGNAMSNATGYQYDVTLEDSNSKDSYPFIRPATPTAQGYAIDAGFNLLWRNGAQLSLAVNDLASKMFWRNMPHTQATANSAILTRDANGYITYNPAVTGVNDINRRSITQKIDRKSRVEFSYPFANWTLQAGISDVKNIWLPDAEVRYKLTDNWQFAANHDFRFQTWGLAIQHPNLNIQLRSDNTDLNQANMYGITASFNITY